MSGQLPDDAVTAAAEHVSCKHHWISQHEPDHRVYWVRVCSQCHQPDWDDLDEQIAAIAARAAAAERAKLSAVISADRFRMLADWLETSPRFMDMTGTEVQDDFRRLADLLDDAL